MTGVPRQLVDILCSDPRRIARSLYWQVLGKRKRARNILGLRHTHSARRYAAWRAAYEKDEPAVSSADQNGIRFLVVVTPDDRGPVSERTMQSLQQQAAARWKLYTPNEPAEQDTYVVWLRNGDTLPPTALLRLSRSIMRNRHPDILYSDHDYVLKNGRRAYPYFKGGWNHVLLLSSDYVYGLTAIRQSTLAACTPGHAVESWSDRYGILMHLGEKAGIRIHHIAEILYHSAKHGRGLPGPELLRRPAGTFHAPAASWMSRLHFENQYGFSVPTLPLPSPAPRVAIVIPTRDMLHVLKPCIQSILGLTRYPAYEILVVDNSSTHPETLAYFREISADKRIRILSYPQEFNYAAINNFAVEQTAAPFICLLNNDTLVCEPHWLDYLLRWTGLPHCGAVGAKLLYPDKRIQHAGVTCGIHTTAGHAHRFLNNTDPGFFYQAHLPQYASAVTGACLLVSRKHYLAVKGLDAANLPVAFNDVDFCLKLTRSGLQNIYEPRAVLYHYESISRGRDRDGDKKARHDREIRFIQQTWGTAETVDPYYSPHLVTDYEDFSIKPV